MRETRGRIITLLLCLFVGLNTVVGNDSAPIKLKVFVEGKVNDFDYLRTNLTFVDFVNDPFESDVHIIVSRKSTGSGGKNYHITFNPVTVNSLENFKLNCITSFEDTQEEARYKFAESIKSGLLVFANEKQIYYQVNVSDNNLKVDLPKRTNNTKDPWNNWIYKISFNGGLDAEEQKKNFEYQAELSVDRITDIWRIRNDYEYGREETFITKNEDSGERIIHAFNQEQSISSRATYSITSHWSAGLVVKGNQTSYRNIKFNGSFKPALEYNVYPWDEVNQRIFTVAYFVGPSYYDYYTPTILNKSSELLWGQNIKIDLEKIEKWGEVEISMEASHYFPNFKYYSLKSSAQISLRIAKGLFLSFEIEAEKINDQLYLQANELSDEELFLNVRKLPTSFELSAQFGIRYQFGSIYNNVVNERL